MKPASLLLGCLLCAVGTPVSAAGPAFPLPAAPAVPEGLGVNIHFTDPRPGEMQMLAQAGFRWVRMDFAWGGTERERGQYDFSAYERLLAALAPHRIRALFILDYSNRHYDQGLSPHTDEGRQAFARWSAAAAKQFQGRGILWEMYNEPNISLWKPHPDVEQYVKLALAVGKAIRAAAPDEQYIGPATSGVDFAFLEKCFQAGLLEFWSAVSVHPYRQQPPETAAADYARLRQLVAKYAPPGKRIPILSGEWGYSSVWQHQDPEQQGRFLARQWLTNLWQAIPVSIWYDWHDDGLDAKEPEHHFGTVLHPHHPDRDPVYDAKPAYQAARTLTTVLAGFHLHTRLAIGGDDDYVLLFRRDDDVRLAAWTTSKDPRSVVIPASPGRFAGIGHTGRSLPQLTAGAQGLAVSLSGDPQYLTPEQPNDLLRVAATWQPAPLELRVPAQKNLPLPLTIRNPLSRPLRVTAGAGTVIDLAPGAQGQLVSTFDVPRSAQPITVMAKCAVEGVGTVMQSVSVGAVNPLSLTALPVAADALAVRVENPSGEPFRGVLRVSDVAGISFTTTAADLDLAAGQREQTVRFALRGPAAAEYRLGLQVEDPRGTVELKVGPTTFRPVDDFARYTPETLAAAYRLIPDGDTKVASTQTLTRAAPPEGPPLPGLGVLKIRYQFGAGWKFVRLAPLHEARQSVRGQPKALGVWLYGDGSGNHPRLRLVDTTGQTFQPNGERLDWTGWRYVVIPLDAAQSGHWGGAADGVIHAPLRWDTLLLIDSAQRKPTQGEVYLAGPTLLD